MQNNVADWLRLQLIPGLGRLGLFRLINHYGSPRAALDADSADWCRAAGLRRDLRNARCQVDEERVETALRQLDELGGELVSFWDEVRYPALLRNIPDPPALLYVRGRLDPDLQALAMVGSRKASAPGMAFTHQLAAELATAGVCVVSGLARGIDTAAHRGALSAAGYTIAVLGCGIDRAYPPENKPLFEEIAANGALISEYPLGSEPLAGHFPGRNRIISGLSRGVLVVEAATGSGSLLTADFALESGREVFAVPNNVCSATGSGVNQLLKDGAHLVTECRDILDILWPRAGAAQTGQAPSPGVEQIPEKQNKLLNLLSFNPQEQDILVRRSGLTPMEVSDSLLQLELLGHAVRLPGGLYVRSR